MQLLPLLCHKYKLAEPMMLLVFAQATRACSIAIDMERLGLTEQEADQCIKTVERKGVEPSTSALRTQRSPN